MQSRTHLHFIGLLACAASSLCAVGVARADVNPTSIDPDPACLGQSLAVKGSFGAEPSRYQLQIRPAAGGNPLASYGRRKVSWSASKLTFDLPTGAVAPGTYRLTVDTFGESGFGVLRNVQIEDCASGGSGGSGGGAGQGGVQPVLQVREPDPALQAAAKKLREKQTYVEGDGTIHIPFDLQLNQESIGLEDRNHWPYRMTSLSHPIQEGETRRLKFRLRYYGAMNDRLVVVRITEPDTGEVLGCTRAMGRRDASTSRQEGAQVLYSWMDVEATGERIQQGRIRLHLELRDAGNFLTYGVVDHSGGCSTFAKWSDADPSNDAVTIAFAAYKGN